MGEYEPDDSRNVTQNPSKVPIEPERTGPREKETRGADKKLDEQTVQRSGDHPGSTDLARGSEVATRNASGHRG